MMLYTIQINDEQRALLVRSIRAHLEGEERGYCMPLPQDDRDELALLQGMLEDLPVQEAEDPGCTHCLHL